MHEFSICQSLVDAIVTEVAKIEPPATELRSARVAVGGLRQIVPEYLQEAYKILTKDTVAEGSVLNIRAVPIRGKCLDCGWEGEWSSPPFLCGACGSLRADIVGGMELFLESLEVEQDDE